MSRTRELAALTVAAAVLAGAWSVDRGPDGWVIPAAPAAVASVTISAGGREVTLARAGGRWESTATTALATEQAGPGYRGVATATGDEVAARIDWILGRLCQRDAMLPLPFASIAGQEFGLDPPAVGLTIRADRTYHLEVGALNPAGDGRYFRSAELGRAGLLARDLAGEISALAGAGPIH